MGKMNTEQQEVLSKVPEVMLIFWIIKILATTLGDWAADTAGRRGYCVWRSVGCYCCSLFPNQDFSYGTLLGGIHSIPTFRRGGGGLPGQTDKPRHFRIKPLLSISGIILVNRFLHLYVCA